MVSYGLTFLNALYCVPYMLMLMFFVWVANDFITGAVMFWKSPSGDGHRINAIVAGVMFFLYTTLYWSWATNKN